MINKKKRLFFHRDAHEYRNSSPYLSLHECGGAKWHAWYIFGE
jgi:hypothetical protein